jgi:hypothetical protein
MAQNKGGVKGRVWIKVILFYFFYLLTNYKEAPAQSCPDSESKDQRELHKKGEFACLLRVFDAPEADAA